MDLANLIRSKGLPNDVTYELMAIARRDDVIEGLLDYIAGQELNPPETDNDDSEEVSELKEKIDNLQDELETCQGELAEYTDKEEEKQLIAESFGDYIEKFQEEKDRYPSIDETWDAAWKSCKESEKKE